MENYDIDERFLNENDISSRTKISDITKFGKEITDKIYELKSKLDIYMVAFRNEVSRLNIPYYFTTKSIQDLSGNLKDRKKVRYLLEFMFGEDFLKSYKIHLNEVCPFGSFCFEYARGYELRLSYKNHLFLFYIPNPKGILRDKSEFYQLGYDSQFHIHRTTKGKEGVWDLLPDSENCSYDWKLLCENIKDFIKNTKKWSTT